VFTADFCVNPVKTASLPTHILQGRTQNNASLFAADFCVNPAKNYFPAHAHFSGMHAK
jgi:hypothetical protein